MKIRSGSTLFALIMVISCSRNKDCNNLELIDNINSIKKTEIIYEIQTDSIGSFLDTLSVEKIKKNENNITVYREKLFFKNNNGLKQVNYYRDNENLFYSKLISSNDKVLRIFESWDKEGNIENGISVEFEHGKPLDTIFINYKHCFGDNELVNKTTIISKKKNDIGNTTELFYNDENNLIKEILIQNNDTLNLTHIDIKKVY